jgi:N-acetylmuramoyl-L-alanine amidase
MDQRKILDILYTARWALNAGKREETEKQLGLAINEVLGRPEEDDEPKIPDDTGTPAPNDPIKATLVLIVGHEKKAPGATFKLGGSEYNYNGDVAEAAKRYAARKYPNLNVHVIYRDGIGIGGATAKASKLKPDACIELHFNAFNGTATGTSTLTTVDAIDRKFAELVQTRLCEVFERHGRSRGVAVLSRSSRGGGNVYGLPGSANVLVEPFFGDNQTEAEMAVAKKENYSMALIDVMVEWCKTVGLMA